MNRKWAHSFIHQVNVFLSHTHNLCFKRHGFIYIVQNVILMQIHYQNIDSSNKRPLSKLGTMLYYCEMGMRMHDEGNDNKSLNYAWHCSQNNPVEVYLIRYLWKKMHYCYPRLYFHQPYLLFLLCEPSFVLNLCLENQPSK